MSRMSDREAWISVFNTALVVGKDLILKRRLLIVNGQRVPLYEWAEYLANKALQDAPKDEA